uniref:Uncharacterized protein n=1 Tax=Arundo donax TaxID=35708 RepID=A0A0A9EEF8_ARUDO
MLVQQIRILNGVFIFPFMLSWNLKSVCNCVILYLSWCCEIFYYVSLG